MRFSFCCILFGRFYGATSHHLLILVSVLQRMLLDYIQCVCFTTVSIPYILFLYEFHKFLTELLTTQIIFKVLSPSLVVN